MVSGRSCVPSASCQTRTRYVPAGRSRDLVRPGGIGHRVIGVVRHRHEGAHPGMRVAGDGDQTRAREGSARPVIVRERDVEDGLLADPRVGVVENGIAIVELEPLANLGRLHVRHEVARVVVKQERRVALGLRAALEPLHGHNGIADSPARADHQPVVHHRLPADLAILLDWQLRALGRRTGECHGASHASQGASRRGCPKRQQDRHCTSMEKRWTARHPPRARAISALAELASGTHVRQPLPP